MTLAAKISNYRGWGVRGNGSSVGWYEGGGQYFVTVLFLFSTHFYSMYEMEEDSPMCFFLELDSQDENISSVQYSYM